MKDTLFLLEATGQPTQLKESVGENWVTERLAYL